MPLGTMNRGWTQSIAPEVEAAVRRLAAVAAMHARCISITGAVSTVPCAVQQSVLATEDDGGVGRRGDGTVVGRMLGCTGHGEIASLATAATAVLVVLHLELVSPAVT
jgi:hypothetical protein